MLEVEYGVTCERCYEQKPDVRYARDVRKHLCNPCWADTPPKDGVPKSGFPDRPPQLDPA
jgi:hypothetical protein